LSLKKTLKFTLKQLRNVSVLQLHHHHHHHHQGARQLVNESNFDNIKLHGTNVKKKKRRRRTNAITGENIQ